MERRLIGDIRDLDNMGADVEIPLLLWKVKSKRGITNANSYFLSLPSHTSQPQTISTNPTNSDLDH